MIQQISNEPIVIALCPEKFFKIHGEHLAVRLIAYAVALDLPITDPQHGSTADHIKAAVDSQKFQRGGIVYAGRGEGATKNDEYFFRDTKT